MSRLLHNLLIGASGLASLRPDAPIREHLISHPLHNKPVSDAEAIASDWYRVGQDLRSALNDQKVQSDQKEER